MKTLMLHIDTARHDRVKVCLESRGEKVCKRASSKKMKAQMLLPLIEALLAEQKEDKRCITHIYVNRGPGSYTGLRVGIAIANALGYALGIPINDRKVGDIETPLYE